MLKKKDDKKLHMGIHFRTKTKLNSATPFNIREAYKITRTNLMFSLTEEGCRKIAIGSAYPSEGKTTTCTNLALSFVQMGKRVLIIDADMRKAQVHHVFNLDNQVGLSNVLGGLATLDEAIHQVEEEGHQMSVLTSGHVPPNPAELLASERMQQILEQLEESYDYIFIDTPPINMVTDAITLTKSLSGMLLVTRQEQSTYKDLEQALGKLKLARTKVLGFILTGDKMQGGKYGKYSKYSKYGRYQNDEAYE